MSSIVSSASALVLVAALGWAQAQVEPLPSPLPPQDRHLVGPRQGPVFLEREAVTISIQESLAKTSVRQTYRNSSGSQAEHIFLFPLPADAAVTDFQMTMDGKPVAGEVLDRERARGIYESIVRAARDPGLLELVGTQLVRARIFPVPPHGSTDVILSYTSPLGLLSGVHTYTYPLRRQALCARPLQNLVVSAQIEARGGLKAIFSPTHAVDVGRQSNTQAKASFEASTVIPDRDFDLYFSEQSGLLGLSALCDKPANKDGAFALFLAPSFATDGPVEAKDIVFVFDTSGSMAGTKMDQARAALKNCIARLGKEDRFCLIPFSTEARPHAKSLVSNDAASRTQALQVVDELLARGGTNIEEALTVALGMRPDDSKRPFQILFMTDGLPTIGVTDAKSILNNVKHKNAAGTRVFVFGVGDDVNTQLLDSLSQETQASREYVRPNENLELKVTALFDRVSAPVATRLSLSFEGIEAYDVYPRKLPDLFMGSQLLVVGRYKQGGNRALRLKGLVQGVEKEWIFEADFPSTAQAHPEISDWWASRKIGFLLDELRLHGSNQELIDEVVKLGKEHGIVTPYTSFLVVEETERLAQARGVPARRWSEDDHGAFYLGTGAAGPTTPAGGIVVPGAPSAPAAEQARRELADAEVSKNAASKRRLRELGAKVSGDSAIEESLELGRLSDGRGYLGGKDRSADNPFVRRVDRRVFHLIDGVWTEASFKTEDRAKLKRIVFLSDAYFALLKSDPMTARILALGPRVLLKVGDGFVEVIEN